LNNELPINSFKGLCDSESDENLNLDFSPKIGDTIIKTPLRIAKSVAFSEQTNDKDIEKEVDYLKPSSLFPNRPFEDIVVIL
jgi:hypothetical protein